MSHLPSLIYDLALILISAGVITLLFKWLKQPLVLGYIVAGILAGPHLDLLPVTVKDTTNVQTWADIGVVFLLFALGLEFSFKKLSSVGKPAVITAIFLVTGMMTAGFFTGRLLNWSVMDSVFLGAMLSMSSTTIIIKAFEDMGIMGKAFTGIVFGILVVEDLVAVILMVMLTTLSGKSDIEGSRLFFDIGRIIFFLTTWFIFGIFLIPSFLKFVRKFLNDETLMIISVGLCLLMVVLAAKSGFSAALGAFIMGSILAETVQVKQIEHVVSPLKNFFGAIFFVSVGMLFNPAVLSDYGVQIIIISFVTIIGQILFSTSGLLFSGQSLKMSMQSGFSLSQVGEFAFIIAALGLSLKVTSDFLYPLIIAVSLITTFTTPYFIKLADPAYNLIQDKIPDRLKTFRKKESQKPHSGSVIKSSWGMLIKEFVIYNVTLTILNIALIYMFSFYLAPFLQSMMSKSWASVITLIFTLASISPFLKAILSNHGKTSTIVLNLWMEKPVNQKILVVFFAARLVIVFATVFYLFNICFPLNPYFNIIFAFLVILIITRSKWLMKRFLQLEKRFLINLNERQMDENVRKIVSNQGVMELTDMQAHHWLDYKLHTCAFRLKDNSPFIGKTLSELNFRQQYNLMVIRIRTKDSSYINIPGADYKVQYGDTLRFAGRKQAMRDIQEQEQLTMTFVSHSLMTLHGFSQLEYDRKEEKERIICSGIPLSGKSPLTGKNLIESKIGSDTKCLVLGLERLGRQIVNPDALTVLLEGDLVWIIGEEKPVSHLIEQNVYFL